MAVTYGITGTVGDCAEFRGESLLRRRRHAGARPRKKLSPLCTQRRLRDAHLWRVGNSIAVYINVARKQRARRKNVSKKIRRCVCTSRVVM